MSEHTCGGRGDVPCPVCTANAAQAAFVAAWRDQHPEEVYGETWPCPLCAQVLQPPRGHFYGVGALVALVDQHKTNHGVDWIAYEALAAGADRATGDGDQEE